MPAVRSYLGFAKFYRFAHAAANSGVGTWDAAHQTAFDHMKKSLICAPILAMYDPELETVVKANSCQVGIRTERSCLTR